MSELILTPIKEHTTVLSIEAPSDPILVLVRLRAVISPKTYTEGSVLQTGLRKGGVPDIEFHPKLTLLHEAAGLDDLYYLNDGVSGNPAWNVVWDYQFQLRMQNENVLTLTVDNINYFQFQGDELSDPVVVSGLPTLAGIWARLEYMGYEHIS